MNIETITPQEAKRLGYRSLTTPYRLPGEQKQLESAMAIMARKNVDYVLCQYPEGPGIWRK